MQRTQHTSTVVRFKNAALHRPLYVEGTVVQPFHHQSQVHALQYLAAVSTKFSFTHSEGWYTYHYSRRTQAREGRLMIRVSKDRMAAFRSSRFGSALEEVVDILCQGNGWYEVTSVDLQALAQFTGVTPDGLAIWLREFNAFFNHHVIAKPSYGVKTVRVPLKVGPSTSKAVAAPERLSSLAAIINARFGH